MESVIYEDHIPITAFSHKKNIIYVYDYVSPDSNKADWTIMTENMQNSLFDTLSNRMLKAYNKWEASLPEDNSEETANKHNAYKSKILGLSICDDTKYRRFTNWLFNHLKKNVKNITEYEFD